MGYFNRDRNSGGNRSFGRRDFGGRRPDREMHPAVCSNCGKDCQVPFRPTGERPVYCSDCFEKNNGGQEQRNFDNRSHDRPRFEGRPFENKPFENRQTNQPAYPQFKEQFTRLNDKLDKILDLLGSGALPIESSQTTENDILKSLDMVEAEKTIEDITGNPEKPAVASKKKKSTKKSTTSSAA